jgi:hypothetical protein
MSLTPPTAGCENTNFDPCLGESRNYLESTCNSFLGGPFQNQTNYNICLCLNKINERNCYGLCDAQIVKDTLAGSVLPSITALCGAVNINPARPPPAPWVRPSTTTSLTSLAPQTASTGAPATTTSSKSSAMTLSGSSIFALAFGIAQILLL